MKAAEKLRTPLFAGVLLGLLSVALGGRTMMRNIDWLNERSFVLATVRDSPNNPKAHNMVAGLYAKENKLDQSRIELEEAVSLSPTYYPGYFNLALLSEREGRATEAISLYQKTLTLNPSMWEAHLNLGVLYMKNKDYETAKYHFQQVLLLDPTNTKAQQELKLL